MCSPTRTASSARRRGPRSSGWWRAGRPCGSRRCRSAAEAPRPRLPPGPGARSSAHGSVKLLVFCGRMTMIKGSIVAIVSPMHEDGSLDFERYRALIDWHVAEGTSAIVAVGTTGESPTVDPDEHIELIRVAVEQAAGRIPVIAGTGGNSTREALELTERAAKVGADATLQVVPYYNKPTQEGMCRHFEMVAERGGLPVILYNVPGRTVADLSNESVLRLAQVPNIIGLKESTGDIPRVSDLLARVPEDFAVY